MWNRVMTLSLVAALAGSLQPAAAETHVVEVINNAFSPSEIAICVGDTVRWEWVGSVPHSTTSGTPNCDGDGGELWDSGVLSTGASFEYTFTEVPPECADDESEGPNTCDYFCIPHCATMTGVITVSEAGAGDAVLDLPTNKLRVAKGGAGRGGTVKGVELFIDMGSGDVEPGSVDLTLTLGGSFGFASETRSLSTSRGNHSGRFAQDTGKELNIRSAIIRGTKDPGIAKVTIKYETNGIDLSGALSLMVDIEQTVEGGCGPVDLLVSTSGPVAH